ncbi:MAG TPA: hypothetical protein VFG23_00930 [Polyangia bacterium]|nr:hypothetical protein [Polyangia bacterium]
MGLTRILDLIVIILLATIILMPRPDASVKPALAVDPELRERVAELQSILIGHPDDVASAIELANIFLDGHRPDWALATVTATLQFHPDDYRLQHVRAIAYADRFEAAPAYAAAQAALALCEREPPVVGVPPCDGAVHGRITLLDHTLASVADVDMKKVPYLAKERIFQQLHPAFLAKPRPKAKTSPKASAPE